MDHNAPSRSPFSSLPTGPANPYGEPRKPNPWKVANYNLPSNAETPMRRMGECMSAFPSKETQNHSFSAMDTVAGMDVLSNPSLDGTYTLPRLPDPCHVPLPSTSDADIQHGPTIAHAIGHSPSPKIAGSRRIKSGKEPAPSQAKGKGKHKMDEISSSSSEDASSDESDGEPQTKRSNHGGRRPGAGNYGEADLKKLLDLTEKELPIGGRGWQEVHRLYAKWAKKNGRPKRDAKALESKFKLMVKAKKPTGDGKRPESITRAKAIDKLITESISMRNINDSDINAEDSDNADNDVEPLNAGRSTAVRTVIARSDRSEAPQARRSRTTHTTELVQKIATALDPEAQRARDEERANRSLHTTQIFTLTQQLRDAHATNDTLRSELSAMSDCLHKVERIRDRLDTELNFEQRLAGLDAVRRGFAPTSHKYDPELTRVKGKIRHDEYFPEGGQHTTWVTDGSSASDFEDNLQDKENYNPMTTLYHPLGDSRLSAYKPQHRKYAPLTMSSSPSTSSAAPRSSSPLRPFLVPASDVKPNLAPAIHSSPQKNSSNNLSVL